MADFAQPPLPPIDTTQQQQQQQQAKLAESPIPSATARKFY